jgi:hypothetical protein
VPPPPWIIRPHVARPKYVADLWTVWKGTPLTSKSATALAALAVGEKHARSELGHLLYFEETLRTHPHLLHRRGESGWLAAIRYFSLRVLQRPGIKRSTSVTPYISSLTLIWPALSRTKAHKELHHAFGVIQPFRPEGLCSTVPDAVYLAGINYMVTSASSSIWGSRMLVHAFLLNHGLRACDAVRFLMHRGIALLQMRSVSSNCVSIRFLLRTSKTDMTGSAIACGDNPFLIHVSMLPVLARVMTTPMTAAQARTLEKQVATFWHRMGVPHILAFRRAAAVSLANLRVLNGKPLQPGEAHALVQQRLGHRPGSAVTRRYSAFRIDAATTARAIEAALQQSGSSMQPLQSSAR